MGKRGPETFLSVPQGSLEPAWVQQGDHTLLSPSPCAQEAKNLRTARTGTVTPPARGTQFGPRPRELSSHKILSRGSPDCSSGGLFSHLIKLLKILGDFQPKSLLGTSLLPPHFSEPQQPRTRDSKISALLHTPELRRFSRRGKSKGALGPQLQR